MAVCVDSPEDENTQCGSILVRAATILGVLILVPLLVCVASRGDISDNNLSDGHVADELRHFECDKCDKCE